MSPDDDAYGDGIPDDVRRALASGNGMVIPIRSDASPDELAATIAEGIRTMRGQVTGEELAEELTEALEKEDLRNQIDALPGIANFRQTIAARVIDLDQFDGARTMAESIANIAPGRPPAFSDETWRKIVDVTLWLEIRAYVLETVSVRIADTMKAMRRDGMTCTCDECKRARSNAGLGEMLADFLSEVDRFVSQMEVPDPPRAGAPEATEATTEATRDPAEAMADDFLEFLYGSDAPRCVTCNRRYSKMEARAGMKTCEHCPSLDTEAPRVDVDPSPSETGPDSWSPESYSEGDAK